MDRRQNILLRILELVLRLLDCDQPRTKFHLSVVSVTTKPRKAIMFPVRINNMQQAEVTLNPDHPLDGAPVFTVLDGDSTVIPAADGLSAMLRSSDTNGVTHIEIKGDAQIGGGITEITETIELTVTDPEATTFGLSVGTPSPKV